MFSCGRAECDEILLAVRRCLTTRELSGLCAIVNARFASEYRYLENNFRRNARARARLYGYGVSRVTGEGPSRRALLRALSTIRGPGLARKDDGRLPRCVGGSIGRPSGRAPFRLSLGEGRCFADSSVSEARTPSRAARCLTSRAPVVLPLSASL